MAKIKLTQGKYAIVDKEDFEWLNQRKWYITKKGYVARTVHTPRPNRIDKTVFMHRIVNNTPNDLFTDHINRNKLDNRKQNLRTVNNAQNQWNKGLQKNNRTGVAGVSWHIKNWWSRIYVNKKQISLGCYSDFEKAVTARKQAERIYYGKYT